MKTKIHLLLALITLSAFVLVACGPSETPAPTDSVDVIYTAAAQTVEAQLTEQAVEQPTSTPTLTPTVTETPTPTATGPTPTQPSDVPPTQSNCYKSTFVADVTIPDNTVMAPGQEFTKTWRIQNSGTCSWSTIFKLVYISGERMNGQPVGLINAVGAGETVDVSVKMIAPTKAGDYTGNWYMGDENGKIFGSLLTVVIKVNSGSVTPGTTTVTPTATNGLPIVLSATPTLTPTMTSTPTITSTATETLTPTVTLTPTP